MAVRDILIYPDERLRTVAKPVTDFNTELSALVTDMFDTMYQDRGVGLAATQINVNNRVIVIDFTDDKSDQIVLINPEIIATEGTIILDEGCLSFPGIYVPIERPEKVQIRFQDTKGNSHQRDENGWLARAFQHEIDHLDGKVFVDYLSPFKRRWVTRKLEKMRKRRL